MPLQGARADLEGASGTIESCVTASQRGDDDGADRLGRRQPDSFHRLM
jgi:hypothetical protein